MDSRLGWILCISLLGVVLVTMAIVSTASAVPEPAVTDELDIDPDDVVIAIELHEDGTADWAIEYRLRLESSEEVDAFEEIMTEMEGDPDRFTNSFQERMEPSVDAAAEMTGRSMSMEDVTVGSERRFVDREYGIVTYRFTWTGFADMNEPDMHVGDAIHGLFLTEETTLVVRWPETYNVISVSPTPDGESETSAAWNGPREFGTNEPRVHLSTDTPAFGLDPREPSTWLLAALIIGILGGIAIVARSLAGDWRETTPAEPVPDDPDLLSNEERVLQFVETEGGRVKQQEIAHALDWTDAKTSKVVRTLRDDGRLEGFRLGRENVLRLPTAGDDDEE